MDNSEVLTPAQRRQLIEAPIRFHIHGRSGPWGGTTTFSSNNFRTPKRPSSDDQVDDFGTHEQFDFEEE